jgi:beta-1,4-N-acetylglucosaminyltransferase
VGTTRFDSLVTVLNAEAEALVEWLLAQGFSRVLLQIGTGVVEPLRLKQVAQERCDALAAATATAKSSSAAPTLSIEWLRHSPDLLQFISRSDLVISHAGAGSILESLRLFRPLLVVINTGLMHNHQLEVAQALERGHYLYQTEPQWIMHVLRTADWTPPVEKREATRNTAAAAIAAATAAAAEEEAAAASQNKADSSPSTAASAAVGSLPPLNHYQLICYPPVQSEAFPQLLEEHVGQILRPTSASAQVTPFLLTTVLPALLAFAITWAIVQ